MKRRSFEEPDDDLSDDTDFDEEKSHACPICHEICDCGMGYMNSSDCEHCTGPESEY